MLKSKQDIIDASIKRLIIRESTQTVIGDAMEEFAQERNEEIKSWRSVAELNRKTILNYQQVDVIQKAHIDQLKTRIQVATDALITCETTLKAFLPDAYATLNIVQQALNKLSNEPTEPTL